MTPSSYQLTNHFKTMYSQWFSVSLKMSWKMNYRWFKTFAQYIHHGTILLCASSLSFIFLFYTEMSSWIIMWPAAICLCSMSVSDTNGLLLQSVITKSNIRTLCFEKRLQELWSGKWLLNKNNKKMEADRRCPPPWREMNVWEKKSGIVLLL